MEHLAKKNTFEQLQQGLRPRQAHTYQLLEAVAHLLPGFQGPWPLAFEDYCVYQQFLS